jgi:hypothetical protein
MSASTWAAASLEVAPAGLDADGEEEAEGGDEAGLEERPGLDGADEDGGVEEDGDEDDGDEEDGADEDGIDEDGDDEGPPECLEWARDGVGFRNRGTDGRAVTAPNGWPAHGAAAWAACTAGPTAPASAAEAVDPAAAWGAAGAQEAGAGRSVRVPDAVGAAGEFALTR